LRRIDLVFLHRTTLFISTNVTYSQWKRGTTCNRFRFAVHGEFFKLLVMYLLVSFYFLNNMQ
jgi:hypothetical protein